MLKNMKIGTRLQLGAGLILILMLTMGLAAFIGMSSIDADVKQDQRSITQRTDTVMVRMIKPCTPYETCHPERSEGSVVEILCECVKVVMPEMFCPAVVPAV